MANGQKYLVIDNSPFMSNHVDSIKITYGNFTELKMISNGSLTSFKLGEIQFDTLTIYLKGFIPIEITGLGAVKDDTIEIKNYSLFVTCMNDTIVYKHEKRKRFSSDYKKDSIMKVIGCTSSEETPGEGSIQINNKIHAIYLVKMRELDLKFACRKRHSYKTEKIHNWAFFTVKYQ